MTWKKCKLHSGPGKSGLSPCEYRVFVRRGRRLGVVYYSTWFQAGNQVFRLVESCDDLEHCRFIRKMFAKAIQRLLK